MKQNAISCLYHSFDCNRDKNLAWRSALGLVISGVSWPAPYKVKVTVVLDDI